MIHPSVLPKKNSSTPANLVHHQILTQCLQLQSEIHGCLCIEDFIYMNTPFNGHCKGSIDCRSEDAKNPSDELGISYRYISGTFAYPGNGSERPLDGCCGGVAWTEQGEPMGWFQFQSKERPLVYIAPFEQSRYRLSQRRLRSGIDCLFAVMYFAVSSSRHISISFPVLLYILCLYLRRTRLYN